MRKIHFDNLKEEKSKELLNYLIANCPDKLKIFALDASTAYGYGYGHQYYNHGYGYGSEYCSTQFYIKGIMKVNIWYIKVLSKRLSLYLIFAFKIS